MSVSTARRRIRRLPHVLRAPRSAVGVRPLIGAICLAIAMLIPVRSDAGTLSLRWLGCAGLSLTDGTTTILHDPYLSRPGRVQTFFRWYRPDDDRLTTYLSPDGPSPELAAADLILIGHSHFDHLGDAPWFATRTGARIVGSPTTAAISQGYGVPATQVQAVSAGEVLTVGQFEIRVVESRHARVMFGRVPFPGEVLTPPTAPIHAISFKMGGALGYLIKHHGTGLSLFVLSSAGVYEPALAALRAENVVVDVLLPATIGRDAQYVPALIESVRPRWVVPHHFDDFFLSIDEARNTQSDLAELPVFETEVRDAAAAVGIRVSYRRPGLLEALTLGAEGVITTGAELDRAVRGVP
jgi:L-ascorbate metabolism protein UlaG (beta-lactamase superfamily)